MTGIASLPYRGRSGAATVKVLITILGSYLAIGWVVGIVALVRSRTNPFHLLDDLEPIKSAVAALVMWPIVLLSEWEFRRTCRRLNEWPVRTDWVVTDYQVPAVWITRKVANSPGEYDWEKGRHNPVDHPGIQELLDLMVPGDELWKFSSGAESWGQLAGRGGYVILRNGEHVAHLTTMMN